MTSTIAICDILGFSELVQKHSLEWVVSDALGWFRKSLHHSVHQGGFPNDVPTLEQLRSQSQIGIAWFSDTILMYTVQDTDECLRSLLSTIAWLLFETNFASSTRIRCGIAYGQAYIDQVNSIYVGSPIIEAYLLEKRQTWSGAALTKSAFDRVPEYARGGFYADWWVAPYDVPIKGGTVEHTLAANWTMGAHISPFELWWSDDKPEPENSDWQQRPDVCEKWKNTKAFHDEVCRFCRRHP